MATQFPEPDARAKISEKLSAGLALLTAALAVSASYEGGMARVALNESTGLRFTVLLVLLGIGLAIMSWIFHGRPRAWLGLAVASLFTTLSGIAIATTIASHAALAYDRPQVSAAFDGKALSFTGAVSLLPRNAEMTVTVYGYPAGCCTSPPPDGTEGEDRGSELYFASTGPDPSGTAKLAGTVPLKPDSYEQVEVRVYRSGQDPNCLRQLPGRKDRAACVQVWTQPLKPQIR